MGRMIDFSDWHAVLTTLASLALITVIGMGIRILVMMTVQERRQRQNRQINERLKALIAAYKTLGGSFTGDLSVDPMHLRELRRRAAEIAAVTVVSPQVEALGSEADADPDAGAEPAPDASEDGPDAASDGGDAAGSDRTRRIRDAVEAALSDILLLGTEEHVRLAAAALNELVAGRRIHTHDLVVSLRAFIRDSLDLDPIPAAVAQSLPAQGPARPGSAGGGGGGGRGRDGGGGGGSGGGGGMGGAGMGMGMGMGLGGGMALGGESAEAGGTDDGVK